jgi:hypothetical protein
VRVFIVGWNAAAGHKHASSLDQNELTHNTKLRSLGGDSRNRKAWRTFSHRTGNSLVYPC